MTPDEQGFLNAMWADPTDHTARGAYADWLDEQEGRTSRHVRDAADSWAVLFWLGIVGEYFPTPGVRKPLGGRPVEPNDPETHWVITAGIELTPRRDRVVILVPCANRYCEITVAGVGNQNKGAGCAFRVSDRFDSRVIEPWTGFVIGRSVRRFTAGPYVSCDGVRVHADGPEYSRARFRLTVRFPRPVP